MLNWVIRILLVGLLALCALIYPCERKCNEETTPETVQKQENVHEGRFAVPQEELQVVGNARRLSHLGGLFQAFEGDFDTGRCQVRQG